jgi:prephenate dehydrogenase
MLAMQRRSSSTVAIVGVGLIGGSIGLALRKRDLAEKVIGIGRSEQRLAKALALGAVTSTTTSIAEGVSSADLVIVCTPVGEIADHVLQAADAAPGNAHLTDAGSTKGSIVAKVEAALPKGKRFVGSHPLAGAEKNGVDFARADLFEDRVVVVTPSENTDPTDLQAVGKFWQSLGANVISMSPDAHDRALATTSHLPHLVASAAAQITPAADLQLTAGGWRDLTRIASSDPDLWLQILLDNRANILNSLAGFEKTMAEFRSALEQADAAKLRQLLMEGKLRRDALGN